jgi:hypothetical protein
MSLRPKRSGITARSTLVSKTGRNSFSMSSDSRGASAVCRARQGKAQLGPVAIDLALPFVPLDDVGPSGLDGLQICSVALANAQSDAVIAERKIGGIEIDRRKMLTVDLIGCRLRQPPGVHRLAQYGRRHGKLKLDLGSHQFHLADRNGNVQSPATGPKIIQKNWRR